MKFAELYILKFTCDPVAVRYWKFLIKGDL